MQELQVVSFLKNLVLQCPYILELNFIVLEREIVRHLFFFSKLKHTHTKNLKITCFIMYIRWKLLKPLQMAGILHIILSNVSDELCYNNEDLYANKFDVSKPKQTLKS